jgi:hypothetical protein
MKTYGGSEFDETDFLLFGEAIKELTYYTYLVEVLGDKATDNKDKLAEYKTYVRNRLLERYNKGDMFNVLNDMVVTIANDQGYREVAGMGDDMLYDFTGKTQNILKNIGINYVLDDLDSIRNVLESSNSRAASRTSSRASGRSSRTPSRTSSSSRGRTKKKKSTKKKKKKTKGKKKKKKPTKRR